jgi:hypothetical protein
MKDCLKELDWLSGGQSQDVPLASLDAVRSLINHWIRFIQLDHSTDERTVKVDGLDQSSTIVLKEQVILDLMKLSHFIGLSPAMIAEQIIHCFAELKNYSFKLAMEEKRNNENASQSESSTSLEIIEKCFKKIKTLIAQRHKDPKQPSSTA